MLIYNVLSFITKKNLYFWTAVGIFLCYAPLLAQESADDDLEDVFELVDPTQNPTTDPPSENPNPSENSIIRSETPITPPPAASAKPTAEELFHEDKDLKDVFDVVPLPGDPQPTPVEENVEFSVESSHPPTSPTTYSPVSLGAAKPLSYHQVHIQFGERRVSEEGKRGLLGGWWCAD